MKKNFCACAVIFTVIVLVAVGCGRGGNGGGSGESVLLTVGERPIGETEAYYFLYSSAHMMRSLFPYIGWTDVIEGVAVNDFIKNEAVGAMRRYYVIHEKAAELSAGLTEMQESELDGLWDDLIRYHGSEEALLAQLEQDGINGELLRYFNETTLLYENLWELYSDTFSETEFSMLIEDWIEEVPYTLSEEFISLDIKELYERLSR